MNKIDTSSQANTVYCVTVVTIYILCKVNIATQNKHMIRAIFSSSSCAVIICLAIFSSLIPKNYSLITLKQRSYRLGLAKSTYLTIMN